MRERGTLPVLAKGMRALCYLRELLLMLLLKPVAAVLRRVSPRYRHVWLVSERGDDARDNGYWFYRYLREEQKQVNARYIITADSPDSEKIARLGGAVRYRSFQHYLLYYCADKLISTHVQPCAPDLMIHYHLANKGIRARGKQVFLQHGIIKDEMQWLRRGNLYIDLFVCGAKPEYDYIHREFGFPEGVAQYLGLCRFDNLLRAAGHQRMILVMPTWRGAHYPSGDTFRQTAFCRAYQSLLESPELHALLKTFNCRMVFYPHIEMQKHMDCFHTTNPRVEIATSATHDVQQLLMDCGILVTDYSSVFFDVAYLRKSVFYYQFDEAEFRKYHYQQGYFDYRRDGFGPVLTDEKTLLESLQACLEQNMRPSETYTERMDAFFPLHDGKNCARTYNAICKLH